MEDNPTCDAAERREIGDDEGAIVLLMQALHSDLRCLDGHAGLGSIEFEQSPARALVHYDLGVRIGELSLPVGFDGLLLWGTIYNRPFLRCLHGLGLCLWRLGDLAGAQRTFERLLSLSPVDALGARFCWWDVKQGRTWSAERAESVDA